MLTLYKKQKTKYHATGYTVGKYNMFWSRSCVDVCTGSQSRVTASERSSDLVSMSITLRL